MDALTKGWRDSLPRGTTLSSEPCGHTGRFLLCEFSQLSGWWLRDQWLAKETETWGTLPGPIVAHFDDRDKAIRQAERMDPA